MPRRKFTVQELKNLPEDAFGWKEQRLLPVVCADSYADALEGLKAVPVGIRSQVKDRIVALADALELTTDEDEWNERLKRGANLLRAAKGLRTRIQPDGHFENSNRKEVQTAHQKVLDAEIALENLKHAAGAEGHGPYAGLYATTPEEEEHDLKQHEMKVEGERRLRGDKFESKAQARFMFAKHPKMAKEFASKTSKEDWKDMPDKVEGDSIFDLLPKEVQVKTKPYQDLLTNREQARMDKFLELINSGTDPVSARSQAHKHALQQHPEDEKLKEAAYKAVTEHLNKQAKGDSVELVWASLCDDVVAPFSISRMTWVNPDQIKEHPDIPFHDFVVQNHSPDPTDPEVYDIASTIYILFEEDGNGQAVPETSPLYLVDGHHHLIQARIATKFVTNRFIGNQLVSVPKLVPAFILSESQGWNIELCKALGEASNYGTNRLIMSAPSRFDRQGTHDLGQESLAHQVLKGDASQEEISPLSRINDMAEVFDRHARRRYASELAGEPESDRLWAEASKREQERQAKLTQKQQDAEWKTAMEEEAARAKKLAETWHQRSLALPENSAERKEAEQYRDQQLKAEKEALEYSTKGHPKGRGYTLSDALSLALDAILAPIAISRMDWMNPNDILLSPDLPIHDDQKEIESADKDDPEVYDVDSKVYLVWETAPGFCYLVDGHHHLQQAKRSTKFVTRKLHKGELTSVPALVPVRVLSEKDGWTLPLVKAQGAAANFGTDEPVQAEKVEYGDSKDDYSKPRAVAEFTNDYQVKNHAPDLLKQFNQMGKQLESQNEGGATFSLRHDPEGGATVMMEGGGPKHERLSKEIFNRFYSKHMQTRDSAGDGKAIAEPSKYESQIQATIRKELESRSDDLGNQPSIAQAEPFDPELELVKRNAAKAEPGGVKAPSGPPSKAEGDTEQHDGFFNYKGHEILVTPTTAGSDKWSYQVSKYDKGLGGMLLQHYQHNLSSAEEAHTAAQQFIDKKGKIKGDAAGWRDTLRGPNPVGRKGNPAQLYRGHVLEIGYHPDSAWRYGQYSVITYHPDWSDNYEATSHPTKEAAEAAGKKRIDDEIEHWEKEDEEARMNTTPSLFDSIDPLEAIYAKTCGDAVSEKVEDINGHKVVTGPHPDYPNRYQSKVHVAGGGNTPYYISDYAYPTRGEAVLAGRAFTHAYNKLGHGKSKEEYEAEMARHVENEAKGDAIDPLEAIYVGACTDAKTPRQKAEERMRTNTITLSKDLPVNSIFGRAGSSIVPAGTELPVDLMGISTDRDAVSVRDAPGSRSGFWVPAEHIKDWENVRDRLIEEEPKRRAAYRKILNSLKKDDLETDAAPRKSYFVAWSDKDGNHFSHMTNGPTAHIVAATKGNKVYSMPTSEYHKNSAEIDYTGPNTWSHDEKIKHATLEKDYGTDEAARQEVLRKAENDDLEAATDCEWTEELTGDGTFTILSGDAGGGLMRVRQKATRADSRNKNQRVYPAPVLRSAIAKGRKAAKAGAMLSEGFKHPDVVLTADGEKYVDNPDRKTARVDDITDVGKDGWVYIVRTILDTPLGRQVADAYKAAAKGSSTAPGISMRFKMRGHRATVDGCIVQVADEIMIHTFDDVLNPAVDGAGQFELLTDSQKEEIQIHMPSGDFEKESHFNTKSPDVERNCSLDSVYEIAMKADDQVDDIMKYEDGGMSPEEEHKFFQGLVDSGLAWQLQGHYGRTAMRHIAEGNVKASKELTEEAKRRFKPFGDSLDSVYRAALDEDEDDDDDQILVQSDYDYPSAARSLGWNGKIGREKCPHRGTDGTVDCPDCGRKASEFIQAAGKYLDNHPAVESHYGGYLIDKDALKGDEDFYKHSNPVKQMLLAMQGMEGKSTDHPEFKKAQAAYREATGNIKGLSKEDRDRLLDVDGDSLDSIYVSLLGDRESPGTMTKMHFEHLADTLKRLPLDEDDEHLHPGIVEHFASALARTNGRFDRDRFVRAASRSTKAAKEEKGDAQEQRLGFGGESRRIQFWKNAKGHHASTLHYTRGENVRTDPSAYGQMAEGNPSSIGEVPSGLITQENGWHPIAQSEVPHDLLSKHMEAHYGKGYNSKWNSPFEQGDSLDVIYASAVDEDDPRNNPRRKFSLIRFHMNGGPRILEKGLSWKEVQEHVNDPETSSQTAIGAKAKAYTAKHGPWFDGFREEGLYKADSGEWPKITEHKGHKIWVYPDVNDKKKFGVSISRGETLLKEFEGHSSEKKAVKEAEKFIDGRVVPFGERWGLENRYATVPSEEKDSLDTAYRAVLDDEEDEDDALDARVNRFSGDYESGDEKESGEWPKKIEHKGSTIFVYPPAETDNPVAANYPVKPRHFAVVMRGEKRGEWFGNPVEEHAVKQAKEWIDANPNWHGKSDSFDAIYDGILNAV